MAKYYLTRSAIEDLSEIWEYTYDKWSEKQADKYYISLLESCQEISNNPDYGKDYQVIRKNLLGFKSNLHIIFSE